MVALAPQGEDNFILNDLALLEISPGDHRVEVLDNKIKRTARSNNFFWMGGISARRLMTRINIHKNNSYILRFFRDG